MNKERCTQTTSKGMLERRKQRFEDEFKIQKALRGGDYTRAELAEELNFSRDTQSISRFFSKKSTTPFTRYAELADLWNVREEYLFCDDDFRTEEDLLNAAGAVLDKRTQTHIELLKLLGYEVKARLYLSALSYKALAADWENIKKTLSDEAMLIFMNWDGKTPIDPSYTWRVPVKRVLLNARVEPDSTGYVQYEDEYSYVVEYELTKDNKRASMELKDMSKMFATIEERAADLAAGAIGQYVEV